MNAAVASNPFDPPTRILVDGTAYQDLPRWYRAAEALRRSPTLPRVEADGFFPFWAVTRHARPDRDRAPARALPEHGERPC